MTGIDLDRVSEVEQPVERMEQLLRSLARFDGQIRSGRISDEERVAREHEPGLGSAREVAHDDAAMLWTMAWRVQTARDHVAQGDFIPVLDRVVRVGGLRCGVNRDRDAELESQSPVARHMVCVRMRLEDAHDPDTPLGRLVDVLLDRERRIDDYGGAGSLVSDEIGSAAEIVVDELREDHVAGDASTACRYRS